VRIVTECSPFARERVAGLALKRGWLRKALDIFKMCEDLEDPEGLALCARLVRGLVLLNDPQLIDALVSLDFFVDVVGALEYDPDAPRRMGHRAALQGGGEGGGAPGGAPGGALALREVVPISSAALRAKIHLTSRLRYLSEVALPHCLDDATFGTLSSLQLFNTVEVLSALLADAAFLGELFRRLAAAPPGGPAWAELVAFTRELCALARHLQAPLRARLFLALIQHGVFDVLTDVMRAHDAPSHAAAADILAAFLVHDAASLRAFLLRQERHALFGSLMAHVLAGEDAGLQAQLLEIMRLLLDPDTMEQAVEKNDFLELFYSEYIDQLVALIGAATDTVAPAAAAAAAAAAPAAPAAAKLFGGGGKKPAAVYSGPAPTAGTVLNVVDLLCYCVRHHSYRVKYYILRNNVVDKVLRLTRRRERAVAVAAVRFMRTCLDIKDEFYHRYLIKNSLFEPIVAAFVANGPRNNLLNSTVLELLDFVRRENIKSLIEHLVERYGARLASADEYCSTVRQLRLRYEQAKEGREEPPGAARAGGLGPAPPQMQGLAARFVAAGGGPPGAAAAAPPPGPSAAAAAARRRRDGSMDASEEDYFDRDDDDDVAPPAPFSMADATPMPPGMMRGIGSGAPGSPPRRAGGLMAATLRIPTGGPGAAATAAGVPPGGAAGAPGGGAQAQSPPRPLPRLVDYADDDVAGAEGGGESGDSDDSASPQPERSAARAGAQGAFPPPQSPGKRPAEGWGADHGKRPRRPTDEDDDVAAGALGGAKGSPPARRLSAGAAAVAGGLGAMRGPFAGTRSPSPPLPSRGSPGSPPPRAVAVPHAHASPPPPSHAAAWPQQASPRAAAVQPQQQPQPDAGAAPMSEDE